MTYLPWRDYCSNVDHWTDQWLTNDWNGACRLCGAPYDRYPVEHMADDTTPHTADIVEPFKEEVI